MPKSGLSELPSGSSDEPAVAIVVPVRNAEGLLRECLEPIRRQLGRHDAMVVVDDASSDGTAEVAAALGARVIRRDVAGGPYAARNDGWRASPEPYILFTDVRCVPGPGWVDRLRRAAAEDNADLIFSDVIIRGGDRLAERVAAHRQHLLARHYTGPANFLPYFPTANLAVRRTALEAVDGFRVMPSGGDADVCWRMRMAGFDRVTAIDEPLMEWRPRARVAELLEQWAKYGRSNAALRFAWAARGATIEPPLAPWRAVARHTRRTARRVRGPRDDTAVVLMDGLVDLTYDLAYGRAVRRLRRGEHA
jgi:glycosyltransferase involved in cell wall biosynthesis